MNSKSNLHSEILSQEQIGLLPVVASFKEECVLVGGTAIALQLGHRRSIDFDLFYFNPGQAENLLNRLRSLIQIDKTFIQTANQVNVVVSKVKWTFYEFPFLISPEIQADFCQMPSLLTLAAMKIFALGMRNNWKDYVDLYCIMHQYQLEEVIQEAKQIFGSEINAKLICAQLSYFNDIQILEPIEWMPDWQSSDEEIKQFLVEKSVEYSNQDHAQV